MGSGGVSILAAPGFAPIHDRSALARSSLDAGPFINASRNSTWTNLTAEVSGGPAPPWRIDPGLAYDAADGYVVLYGGLSPLGLPLNDTWTFAHGAWRNLTASLPSAPPPLGMPAMTYDAADGYVLLFGGLVANGFPPQYLAETWAFHNGSWTNLTGTVGAAPGPRYGASLAYDPSDGVSVLYGGCCRSGSYYNDTWTYRGGTWHPLGIKGPFARFGAGLAPAETSGGLVLFGGAHGASGTLPIQSTWLFLQGKWTLLRPLASPPGQGFAALADDATDGYNLELGAGGTWRYANGNWTNATPDLVRAPPRPSSAAMVFDAADDLVLAIDDPAGGNATSVETWAWAYAVGSIHPPGPKASGSGSFLQEYLPVLAFFVVVLLVVVILYTLGRHDRKRPKFPAPLAAHDAGEGSSESLEALARGSSGTSPEPESSTPSSPPGG
jgi:hypothetical protein